MYIHVVKPGESIYLISRYYGIPMHKIISDNELASPNRLVAGQTLVILTPQQYDRIGTYEVNGYAFPSTDLNVLYKTFPYLTYLSIFSYAANPDGSLIPIDDTALIQAAWNSGVAPVMVVTNKGFSSDVASSILQNSGVQDRLLANILNILTGKGYHSLNIDFEYVYPSERENYNDFISKTVEKMRNSGYKVSTALAPKTSAAQTGTQYTAHDYPAQGRLVDKIILMTYEWGYIYGPPMAVSPVNEVKKVLEYAVSVIPSRKILMGMPNYGYDWTLPYKQGTAAKVVSNTEAVQLAYNVGADIKYDTTAQAPYFTYYDKNGRQHIVWFDDARSIYAKLQLPHQYNLDGVSYWTLETYFPQNWLVLNSLYNVSKIT